MFFYKFSLNLTEKSERKKNICKSDQHHKYGSKIKRARESKATKKEATSIRKFTIQYSIYKVLYIYKEYIAWFFDQAIRKKR